MKIRPVGASYSMRTDRRKDGHGETNSRFSQFFERAWKRSNTRAARRHSAYKENKNNVK